jgi:hypothetical protein
MLVRYGQAADPDPPSTSSPHTLMSSTVTSFQPILNAAFDNYSKQTGVDLTKHPSAEQLQNCCSPDDIVRLLKEKESAFSDYRDKYRSLIDCLCPIVTVVHAFSSILGEVDGIRCSGYCIFSI